ncbi:MAG: hypothetical protein RLZZ536_2496 [Planctomycetota bacterium]
MRTLRKHLGVLTSKPVKLRVKNPAFPWVQSQSDGQLRPGTRGIATPKSTSRFDDLDQVHLFKMSGFLPSLEPAIGRSQELATNGVCIHLTEADAATTETVISAVGRLAHETADASQRLEAREEAVAC